MMIIMQCSCVSAILSLIEFSFSPALSSSELRSLSSLESCDCSFFKRSSSLLLSSYSVLVSASEYTGDVTDMKVRQTMSANAMYLVTALKCFNCKLYPFWFYKFDVRSGWKSKVLSCRQEQLSDILYLISYY